MMKISNKKYGSYELPEPLTQDQLEQYYEKLKPYRKDMEEMSSAQFRGLIVKIVSELGWIPELPRDDARKITWLGNEIIKYISSYEIVDPN
jgi:hypothetical protein